MLAPIQIGAGRAFEPVRDLAAGPATLDAKGENDDLRREVSALRGDLAAPRPIAATWRSSVASRLAEGARASPTASRW